MPAPTSTTRLPAHRLPAPALFIGPPTTNPSQTPPSPSQSRRPSPTLSRGSPSLPSTTPASPSTHAPRSPSTSHFQRPSRSSLVAQHATLAQTLDEVEAAAASASASATPTVALDGPSAIPGEKPPRLFGAAHADALAGLRAAQIRLAGAWGPREGGKTPGEQGVARSDGEERRAGGAGQEQEQEHHQQESEHELSGAQHAARRRARTASSAASAGVAETDLHSAEERRRRNEEYFAGVRASVDAVVAKLDEVSAAMRRVESRGAEVWEGASGSARSSISEEPRGPAGRVRA